MCLSNGKWSANLPTCLSKCFAVRTHKNDFCYAVETLYREHHWDLAGCPVWIGVPNSVIDLYTDLCSWDSRQCPY